MKETIQYFNSQEVAKILGVNVSSIKRWTDEGKLECIKTAGGHRKFVFEHLAIFLEKSKKKTSKVNLFPLENRNDLQISHYILKGNFEYLQNYLLLHALKADRGRIQQVLNGLYLGQYPLHQIYDNLITPVLYRIGEQWHNDQISIVEEHLASQAVRDAIIRLQGIIRVPKKKIGNVLCLNLSSELHDIALKMVDHILETRGFNILFSGQRTAIPDIQTIFEKQKLHRVYISSTFVEDKDVFEKELIHICDTSLENGVKVYVGGQGFRIADIKHPVIVRQLFTFEETYRL